MPQQFATESTMDGVRGRGEHLILGLLAGIIAAVVGALIWMGITIATGYHVGYVALGVGALVGLSIRFVGNGTSLIFGIFGAVLTFLGCLGGEILTVVQLSTSPEHGFYSVLTTVDLPQLVPHILDKTEPLMYLIYAIGIYEGYKFSIRK
jgi:ABC-type transporter Mla maintaining outer membrane lipid asymmetry permease subunit MlaE